MEMKKFLVFVEGHMGMKILQVFVETRIKDELFVGFYWRDIDD